MRIGVDWNVAGRIDRGVGKYLDFSEEKGRLAVTMVRRRWIVEESSSSVDVPWSRRVHVHKGKTEKEKEKDKDKDKNKNKVAGSLKTPSRVSNNLYTHIGGQFVYVDGEWDKKTNKSSLKLFLVWKDSRRVLLPRNHNEDLSIHCLYTAYLTPIRCLFSAYSGVRFVVVSIYCMRICNTYIFKRLCCPGGRGR
jgi:hypothetical protein